MLTRMQTDRGIVRRILHGNRDAFGVLLDRYGNMVYGVAYARLGNSSDAEEIAQEVFVRLYQRLDRVADRRSIGPWLIEVARNASTDILRKRMRETSLDAVEERPGDTPDVSREEMTRAVWDEMAHLNEDQREILILHYFQKRRLREIAQVLGVSTPAVRKRLQRARDELGRRMLIAIGESCASEKNNRERRQRILAAVGVIPTAWKPSAVVALADAAIVGAGHLKVTTCIAAAAIIIAVSTHGGWRWWHRPVYSTQDVTASSSFTTEKSAGASQASATGTLEEPAPSESADTGEAGGRPSVAVRVEPEGAVVCGMVRDQAAQPVSGATVTLDNDDATDIVARLSYPYAIKPLRLSATTDAAGRFDFPRVPFPADSFSTQMRVGAETTTQYGSERILVSSGLRKRYVELVVEPVGAVSGRVVDESGTGVADADVQAYDYRLRDGSRSTKTAADGSFELGRLAPMKTFHVSVGARGFLPLREERMLDARRPVVFRLTRGNSIGGRVVNAIGGQPIAGVTVVAADKAFPHMGDGKIDLRHGSAETDERGEFTISGMEPGLFMLNLKKPSEDAIPYVLEKPLPVVLPDDRPITGIELRAVQGASVSGRVLDADTGEGIPRAEVIFKYPDWEGRAARIWTDSAGNYAASPLGLDRYRVEINGPDESKLETEYTVASLAAFDGVDFRIQRDPVVRGKVVDDSNTPVAGVSVVAVPLKQFASFTTTDASGEFRVAVSPEKRAVYLQAFSDDLVSRRVGPVYPGRYEILTLLSAGRIEGTVVDTSGRPVADCYVVAVPNNKDMFTMALSDGLIWHPADNMDGTEAKTSRTGAFDMDPLMPGTYRIEIYLRSCIAGYPAATTRATVQAGQTLRARLVVDSSGYGAVQGTVTVGDTPSDGTFVCVNPPPDSEKWIENMSTRTDSNGWYCLPNVRPGTVAVMAFIKPEGLGQKNEVRRTQVAEIAAGETQTVDFHVDQRASGIEGNVTMDGKPSLMSSVRLVPAETPDSEETFTAETDLQGRYRLTGLPEGQYIARVTDWMGQVVYATAPVEIGKDEMTRQDFDVQSGGIEGSVAGLREGEKAVVVVFAESVDFGTIMTFDPALEKQIIASAEVTAGQSYSLKMPPGTYLVGVVAIPTDVAADQASILSSVGRGRYNVLQIQAPPGEVAPMDLALP